MGAFVRHKYERGFVLSEEALIRCRDIIKRRVITFNTEDFIFRVYRDDGLTADYSDPSEMINSDEVVSVNLDEVRISAEKDDSKISVRFDKESGASIEMEIDDRDTAFLVSSELREYLSSAVLRHRKLTISTVSALPIVLMAGFFLTVVPALWYMSSASSANIVQTLASKDDSVKLNYLIERDGIARYMWLIPIFGMIIVPSILLAGGAFFSYLYPRNVFYFGKEGERFDQKKVWRDRIVWILIAGIVISVGSSLIIDKFGIS